MSNHLRRYCLTLNLKDDELLIAEYKRLHQRVWPEILESIRSSGIEVMDIYLLGNRLCMVIEVDSSFSFEAKAASDSTNPKVQDWENLMWRYQAALPQAKPGEKWLIMEQIFRLDE